MNAKFPIFAWAGCAALLLLGGCKANVDLNNLDTKTQLDFGVALPIGTISATLGDFLGTGQIDGLYFDSIDNKGVLTYKDTFTVERKFNQMDLSQYISETTISMNVYDKLAALPIMHDHKIIGSDDYPVTLEFPLALQLAGINGDEDNERLDSVLIEKAKMISTISTTDLPLKWEWINYVTLDLGKQCSRDGGKVLEIYRKGDGYGYGQDIPIEVSHFSLNLMKNSNPSSWEEYEKNVVDSCAFIVRFNFTVPTSAGIITIPETAAFDYTLSTQFFDYSAIWGMFTSSDQMYAEDTMDIADGDMWGSLKQATLPVTDPTVDINITTQISGALQMEGEYLFVATRDLEDIRYASFDGQNIYRHTFREGEYLPLTSEIGDSVTMKIRFDKDPSRGEIDKMFAVRPDVFGYKFSVGFDREVSPQLRVVPNTGVRVEAIATIPLIFNEGLALVYADTLDDVDVSDYTIDSLAATIDGITIDSVRACNLKLLTKFKNTIPLRIKVVLRALDGEGNLIMDPNDPTKPYRITTQDTITIDAPKVEYTDGAFRTTASETTEIVTLDKARMDKLADIQSIVCEAGIDNEALQYAYELGNYKVRITKDNRLTVQLGLAANVDATFDFEKDDNNNK